jgi:hypothetical protein
MNFVGGGVEHRRRRATEALDEASRESGHTVDDLLTFAGQDDRRSELAFRALTAASQATLDEKVRALGRALATGVLAADDAIVDRETYVVDALSALQPPHVRVLEILEKPPIRQENGRIYRSVDLAWTPANVESRYPQAKSVIGALFATLSAIGAVKDIALGTLDYEATYELSDFGRLLLARLREAAGADM